MSFGITMATFTAQNFGARQYGRILTGIKQSLIMNILFSLLAGFSVIFFGHYLVALFVDKGETQVFQLAQVYFNISGVLYVILAVLFILRYTLQGLGQAKIPTFAGIMELLMRSFAAIILTGLYGYPGAAFASPLAWIGSVSVLLPSTIKAIRKLKELERQQKAEELGLPEEEHKPVTSTN